MLEVYSKCESFFLHSIKPCIVLFFTLRFLSLFNGVNSETDFFFNISALIISPLKYCILFARIFYMGAELLIDSLDITFRTKKCCYIKLYCISFSSAHRIV